MGFFVFSGSSVRLLSSSAELKLRKISELQLRGRRVFCWGNHWSLVAAADLDGGDHAQHTHNPTLTSTLAKEMINPAIVSSWGDRERNATPKAEERVKIGERIISFCSADHFGEGALVIQKWDDKITRDALKKGEYAIKL